MHTCSSTMTYNMPIKYNNIRSRELNFYLKLQLTFQFTPKKPAKRKYLFNGNGV